MPERFDAMTNEHESPSELPSRLKEIVQPIANLASEFKRLRELIELDEDQTTCNQRNSVGSSFESDRDAADTDPTNVVFLS